jgi:hypothetical protein
MDMKFNCQVPAPKSPADVTAPADGITMNPEYARAVARSAYIWGWPMVNMMNRSAKITQAPHPGLLNGILPAAPRGQIGMLHDYIEPSETFVTCPNQDVVYGLGFFSLNDEPVIAQVRTSAIASGSTRCTTRAQINSPSSASRTVRSPGSTCSSGRKGEKPADVEAIIRSRTALANAVPRIFMDDTPEDKAAIQSAINQVVFYPLKDFDGKMKTIKWNKAASIPGPKSDAGAGETKWVIPEKFFDELPAVLETVPPLPGEESLYAQFHQLMTAAKADPELKKLLVEAAVETEKQVIQSFLQWKYNGRPAGNRWNRSTNNAQWGVDYYNRTGTARSNMFDNKPNETQYFYTDFDSTGQPLDGKSIYSVTFAKGQTPPVNGFWSLTLYNDKHLFHPNDLKRYSLGTKNKNLQYNADGSLTLYAGTKSLGKEKESNWLPAPDRAFSVYIRAYWGKEPILDGSWQPPKIERVH